jgi:hypothetical protein
MNKLTWAFHALITLPLGLLGAQKVLIPIPDLIAQGMWWVESFPAWQVRVIGGLEVLGVLGLNLPYVLKALPRSLVPLAAGGLAATMVGAVVTHLVRQDPAPSVVITASLFAMSATVAWRRRSELGVFRRAVTT